MYIFQFNKEIGKKIHKFNSNFVMSQILQFPGQFNIGCAYLEREGTIGYHEAPIPQLLLIVNSEGKVQGNDNVVHDVKQGDAVYWEQGEWHKTRTDSGLTAIIIESEDLNFSKLHFLKK